MMWKNNLEQTKKHFIDWWQHKGLVVSMWEHFQEGVAAHADVPPPPPPRDLDQKWFDPVWRAQYLDWYVAHSSTMADMLPVANTQLGPGSLAAILGGGLEGGEDTIWIHPNPRFTDDITFDPHHPNWLLHKQLLMESKQRAKGHYYVGMPDLMEGLDVLAALKGTDQVLLDTVMQPEVLEHQMQVINDIYFQVFDELYDIIREGDEMAFCYFSSWAPGKMTKLQCDISTMISDDDYRRFVLPFLRQQCQRIDYTLYHLDGVGAVRHLPALLEIDELDAIQWTPGVGQPQGGSPQWYPLYRRILDAGKSIMASWVTLDELRPLLDHLGGEGVHVEMDFHNEREVEQALRIVEEYQRDANNSKPASEAITVRTTRPSIQQLAQQRVLILDGGMGTMIQRYGLDESDFRGERFANHPVPLKGCNDLLALTRPDVVADIHRKYLEAGADLIETNTFSAQRISLAGYGMERYSREVCLEACRIARRLADDYSTPGKPRYVLGAVGPTTRVCSMATGNEPPLSKQLLRAAYDEQMEALLDGDVDAILIETIFDTLNARIAIDAAHDAMGRRGKRLPIMLSFTVATPDGHNMLGQSVTDFIASLNLDKVFSVGLNCLSDVKEMMPLIAELGAFPVAVSLYPNAGVPDAQGIYSKTPADMQRAVWPLLDAHRLNILGGCCGTNDDVVRAFARLVQPVDGLFLSPHEIGKGQKHRVFRIGGMGQSPRSGNSAEKSEARADADEHLSPVAAAVINGQPEVAMAAVEKALGEGAEPQHLVEVEMMGAMSRLGQQFEEGKVFVPQLLMAGKAMKAALGVLKPFMGDVKKTVVGKVVIGTVKGDLHDIGKNIVVAMLEGCGFEVLDIGIDVSAEKFIGEVQRHNPDILCMSALLTTTMGYMGEVIKALEEAGLRSRVKVMVGGAPVTQHFADQIGADGYSNNANGAVTLAKQLLANRYDRRSSYE